MFRINSVSCNTIGIVFDVAERSLYMCSFDDAFVELSGTHLH